MCDTFSALERGQAVRPDRLNDWEKQNFEKIFKTMDDFSKTKTIKKESLTKLFDKMAADDTYLGKVPTIGKEQFEQLVNDRLKDKKEISYVKFRLLLDDFAWKVQDQNVLKERSDKLYADANYLLKFGKDVDALNECIKAMGLTKALQSSK